MSSQSSCITLYLLSRRSNRPSCCVFGGWEVEVGSSSNDHIAWRRRLLVEGEESDDSAVNATSPASPTDPVWLVRLVVGNYVVFGFCIFILVLYLAAVITRSVLHAFWGPVRIRRHFTIQSAGGEFPHQPFYFSHQPYGNCWRPTNALPFSVTVRYGWARCQNHVVYE